MKFWKLFSAVAVLFFTNGAVGQASQTEITPIPLLRNQRPGSPGLGAKAPPAQQIATPTLRSSRGMTSAVTAPLSSPKQSTAAAPPAATNAAVKAPAPAVQTSGARTSTATPAAATAAQNQQPVTYANPTNMQQIREDHDFDNVQTNEILQHLIENRGSDTRNPKWDTYQYSDNFVFYYGGRGAGKIGNGLCTKENKDKGAPQAQDGGYCEVLRSVLTDGQSCASRHLQSIQNKPIDGIKEYCPNFDQIHDSFQRNMVYLQILASLITAESGWKADAKEKAWLKGDGRSMGGKGLFQIDERDAGQDDGPTSDCQDAKNNVMDPKVNIKCGACIALKNLDKDSTIGKGTGDSGAVGMARYFGPFRDAQSSKSNAIKGAVGAWCAKAASSHSTDMFGGASSGSSNR